MNTNNKDKTNIPSYPENLFSLVKHPRTYFLSLRIAVFALFLISLSIGWYEIHHLVIEKQNKISGIYTLAFFQNDEDTRTSEKQALSALKILKEDTSIKSINIIDNSKVLPENSYTEKTVLPSLIHVQINNGNESSFKVSLHNLFETFPSFAVRNHDNNPRVINLKKRYDDFLFILSICSLAAVLLLLSSFALALKKWLSPHNETITLLHIIGADDNTVLHVFSKYIHTDIIKGISIGIIATLVVLLLPLEIISRTNITKLSTSGVIEQISPLSIVFLALICAVTIYIITRLRIHQVLRQYLHDSAAI